MRPAGRLFPRLAGAGQEVVARRRFFSQLALGHVAVIADRRGVHEHPGARGGAADRSHHVVRRFDAAGPQALLLPVVPAFPEDGFAGQVDHSVAAIEPAGPVAILRGIALDDEHVGAQPFGGTPGVAREHDRLVAAAQQGVGQGRTDQPRPASDKDPHATLRRRRLPAGDLVQPTGQTDMSRRVDRPPSAAIVWPPLAAQSGKTRPNWHDGQSGEAPDEPTRFAVLR